MLLSSQNTISDYRVMDDFTDQDWFAESDEANHINNRPNEQQQQHNLPASFLHVPAVDDLPFQDGNFLALNVPVDENVYFPGDQQQLAQVPNHYQEATSAGTSTTFLEVGQQNGNAAERQPASGFPTHQRVQLEQQQGNNGKCQYMDCAPSTSLAQLRPCSGSQQRELHEIHYQEQQQQQIWRHETRQQSHFDQYQPRSGQQFVTMPENDSSNSSFYNDHFHHQNAPIQSHSMLQPDHSMVSYPAPPINHHVQQSQPHYMDMDRQNHQQQPHYQYQPPQSMRMCEMPANFASSSSDHLLPIGLPPNNNNYQQQTPVTTTAKTVTARKSKPKNKKPAGGPQQLNKQPAAQKGIEEGGDTAAETTESSSLNQVIGSLLSNQRSATLEFSDPQLAVEFGQLMGRCQQLMEQNASGMDVSEELRAVEASIAECIMRNTQQSANCTPQLQQQQQSQFPLPPFQAPSIAPINNSSQSTAPKKSRPKKKPPPKQPQAVVQNVTLCPIPTATFSQFGSPPETASISQFQSPPEPPPIAGHILQSACSSSTMFLVNGQQQTGAQIVGLEQQMQITQPKPSRPKPSTKKKPTVQTSNLDQSNVNSSQKLQPVQANIQNPKNNQHILVQQQKYISQTLPVFVPNSTASNKQPLFYSKRNIHIIKQETLEEVEARLAKQRKERHERLTKRFAQLGEQIRTQDYKGPFRDKADCIKRLLPFGLFLDPELSQNHLDKYDAELQRHSGLMRQRQKSVEQRIRSIMFRQAMGGMEEDKNLLLFLDAKYESEQLNKEIAEKVGETQFEPLAGPSTKFDWEYADWDERRYLNIPPFSPSPSPHNQPRSEFVGRSMESETISDDKYEEEDDFSESEVEIFKEWDEADQEDSKDCFASLRVHLKPYSPGYHASSPEKNIERNEAVTADHEELQANSFIPSFTDELVMAQEDQAVHAFPSTFDDEEIDARKRDLSKLEEKQSTERLIVPIEPKDIAIHRHVELPNGSIGLSPFNEKHDLQSPVKLKIKLGSKKKESEAVSANADNNNHQMDEEEADRKMRKKLKKMKKAEKKARKLEKQKEKQQREQAANEEAPSTSSILVTKNNFATCSTSSMLPRNLPLKISLKRTFQQPREEPKQIEKPDEQQQGETTSSSAERKRVPCWKEANETVATPSNHAGGMLKLRISKQVLANNTPTALPQQFQNGSITGDDPKRKRGKKRRSHQEEGRKAMGSGIEQIPAVEESKKVPRIKIRFGKIGDLNGSEQKQRKEAREEPIVSPNPNKVMQQPPHLEASTSVAFSTLADHQQQTSSLFPVGRVEKRPEKADVQFSPCCSDDDSDTELRQRTNQLLSKIGRF